MKKSINKDNVNIIETLIDIVVIFLDYTTDKIADYIKFKDLERRLKL